MLPHSFLSTSLPPSPDIYDHLLHARTCAGCRDTCAGKSTHSPCPPELRDQQGTQTQTDSMTGQAGWQGGLGLWDDSHRSHSVDSGRSGWENDKG